MCGGRWTASGGGAAAWLRPWAVALACLSSVVARAESGGQAASPRFDARPFESSGQAGSEPWLGVLLVDAADGGAEVVEVVPASPADRAGVRAGDLVIEVGGQPAYDRRSLRRLVRFAKPGEPLKLLLMRDGRVREITVFAARKPAFPPARLDEAGRVPSAPALEHEASALQQGIAVAEVGPELRRHLGAPEDAGLLVTSVAAESAAEKAGLRPGDLLLRAGRRPLRKPLELRVALEAARGKTLSVDVHRPGAERSPLRIVLPVPAGDPSAERLPPGGVLEGRLEELRASIAELKAQLAALEAELDRLEKAR